MIGFVAFCMALAAAGTVAGVYSRRKAGQAGGQLIAPAPGTIGGKPVTPPASGGQLPPSILGAPVTPPASPPPGPGNAPSPDAGNPSAEPTAGRFYQPKTGDLGVNIAAKAYTIPTGGGMRVRAWESIRKHQWNRALSPSGFDTWSGNLYPKHAAPGQHPFGSGHQYPVIWLPPVGEVTF